MTSRPLIMIDVDGVLNVITSAKERRRLYYREGWKQRRASHDGEPYRLFLNPAHGTILRLLAAETGAELAWGSTWEDGANYYVAPVLGLPVLPFAPVQDFPCPAHVADSARGQADCLDCGHKACGIVPWTRGRPFAWFDDEPDAAKVCARVAGTQPHLVVPVDEREGLMQRHADIAGEWLARFRQPG